MKLEEWFLALKKITFLLFIFIIYNQGVFKKYKTNRPKARDFFIKFFLS